MRPLYVLAGGQSRRFGSDKALAEVDGEPLIMRVVRVMGADAPVWIVGGDGGRYEALCPGAGVADRWPGEGPLGGLGSALAHRLTTYGPGWLAVAPCDLWALDAGWWAQLEAARLPAHRAAAFRDEARWHPLVGLYHTDLLGMVEALMASGERALWRLLESAPACAVAPPAGWRGTSGVNSPDDLNT